MIYLFTTPSCPYCPTAKRLVEEKHIPAIFIDATKPEGLFLAKKYQLTRVPSLVQVNHEENLVTCLSGIEEITARLDTLSLSLS